MAQLPTSSPGSSPDTRESVMLDAISPGAKKRAKRKLKLDDSLSPGIKKALRLDKVDVQQNDTKGHVRNQDTNRKIQEWLLRDENSFCVPDKKKSKKGLAIA